MDFYTTQELAKKIRMDRHSIPVLREAGLLNGIKTGRNWIYSEQAVNMFWEQCKGYDLSTPEKIRTAALLKKAERGEKRNV